MQSKEWMDRFTHNTDTSSFHFYSLFWDGQLWWVCKYTVFFFLFFYYVFKSIAPRVWSPDVVPGALMFLLNHNVLNVAFCLFFSLDMGFEILFLLFSLKVVRWSCAARVDPNNYCPLWSTFIIYYTVLLDRLWTLESENVSTFNKIREIIQKVFFSPSKILHEIFTFSPQDKNNSWNYSNNPIQKFGNPWFLILWLPGWSMFLVLWWLFMSSLFVLYC